MPTPKEGYYLADGTRVPGVTTIISRFKESGGLMYWAWNEGREGRDYRDTSRTAADAGTLAHALVESRIKHVAEPDMSGVSVDIATKARGAFAAYLTKTPSRMQASFQYANAT